MGQVQSPRNRQLIDWFQLRRRRHQIELTAIAPERSTCGLERRLPVIVRIELARQSRFRFDLLTARQHLNRTLSDYRHTTYVRAMGFEELAEVHLHEQSYAQAREYFQRAIAIYQEIGTMINTLRFAESIGDGICKQVSQGNDTDSFGCTCGSILGAFFGPGHLEPRWLEPFNDTIHTSMATFHEQRLSAVARRMGELPSRVLG